MSEGRYNESDDEHLFEHPDDEMDLSIPVVDSEADDHWRSVPRKTSHQNIKSFTMSDDDEDLFPHEEDDIDLSIDCYDLEYGRWYKTPVDLEHVHRENAKRKETEYFTLLSGS